MRTTSFQQSPGKAFVQSQCFARNRVGGPGIFFGMKNWRGYPNFRSNFGTPVGNTLYLGVRVDQRGLDPGGFGNSTYHFDNDKFGSKQIIDDGSNPNIKFGFPFAYLGNLEGPSFGYGDTGSGGPDIHQNRIAVTRGATVFDALITGPYVDGGGPPEHPLFSEHYELFAPYTIMQVFAEAIAVARNATVKGGETSSGVYHEKGQGSNTFQTVSLFPFARTPFANGNSQWFAGWKAQDINTNINESGGFTGPWDGQQHHLSYKTIDDSCAINFDGTRFLGPGTPFPGQGNPHNAKLVTATTGFSPFQIPGGDWTAIMIVMCSTFSGSGALATYENRGPVDPIRVSCVDLAANNTILDPVFPTGSFFRWQIFFPGKKASEIPLPNTIWS